MAHCPYCGAEMPENAAACPRCKSCVGEERKSRPRSLSRLLHPAVTLAIIVLVSLGIGAVDLLYEPANGDKKPAVARTDRDRQGSKAGKSGQNQPSPDDRNLNGGRGREKGKEDESKNALYNRVLDYEKRVMEVLDKVDSVSMKMDELKSKRDKASIAKMGEKLKELHDLQREIRNISSLPQLQYAHNHLARFVSMLTRAYRRHMIYMQSRQERQIRLAEEDMTRAEKLREQGLSELEEHKKRLAPPLPPTPPAPPPEEKPEPPQPEPADEDTTGTAPAETVKEYPPMPPATDDGQTVMDGGSIYYEDGDSVYYEEGGTVYYEDGATIYMEDSDTVYYEPHYEEAPGEKRYEPGY